MFGIGWAEFVFLAIAALLVLGPEKLPDAARQLGKWMRDLRAASSDLRREFQSEFDDTGFDSLSRFTDFDTPDEDKELTLTEGDFGKIQRGTDTRPDPEPDSE